jgi:hypothetical protein
VRGFFNAWIDGEIAMIERRARISELQRQLDQHELQLDQLDEDLGAAADQSRLLALLPRWQANALAANELSFDANTLVDTLEHYVTPLFELRYPAALATLRTTAATQLAALRNLDIDADSETVVAAILDFATRVDVALQNAQVDLSSGGLTQIAVVFPRPDLNGGGECQLFGTCYDWPWKVAQNLVDPWNNPSPDGKMTLRVTPEDLYEQHGGVARLDCDDQAPVIRRMDVYLAFNDDINLDQYNLRLPVRVSPLMHFPTVAGLLDYIINPAATSLSVRVTSGLDRDAITRLPPVTVETTGDGLSPLGDFVVDITNLPPQHLAAANAFVLVFEVERHRPGTQVALPGVCQ